MTKTLQVVLDDTIHRNFQLWCISRNKKMAEFLKEIILKCLEGFDPTEYIKMSIAVEACSHVELATAGGHTIRLPIPNFVQQEGDHRVITIPDDTSEEDVALIATIPNTIVKTNKEWRTEVPMEVVK